MRIHILGAGMLGRLIIDIIESQPGLVVGGVYDDGYPDMNDVYGYPIVGKLDAIDRQPAASLAIGIGEPKWRKKLYEEKKSRGFELPALIHRSVTLSNHCTVEPGVIIGPNSSVLAGSVVGRGTCILSHVNINQDVTINPYSLIGAGVVIGNNAILGEGCHVGLASHVELGQNIKPWSYHRCPEAGGRHA